MDSPVIRDVQRGRSFFLNAPAIRSRPAPCRVGRCARHPWLARSGRWLRGEGTDPKARRLASGLPPLWLPPTRGVPTRSARAPRRTCRRSRVILKRRLERAKRMKHFEGRFVIRTLQMRVGQVVDRMEVVQRDRSRRRALACRVRRADVELDRLGPQLLAATTPRRMASFTTGRWAVAPIAAWSVAFATSTITSAIRCSKDCHP